MTADFLPKLCTLEDNGMASSKSYKKKINFIPSRKKKKKEEKDFQKMKARPLKTMGFLFWGDEKVLELIMGTHTRV